VDDLEALLSETLDRYARIDEVVNSTGHPASGEILDLTDEQWNDALDLVVLNRVRGTRAGSRDWPFRGQEPPRRHPRPKRHPMDSTTPYEGVSLGRTRSTQSGQI
jgi:NAD(P)-dependent dehydrogenase (short-subunit alcohol dehydrogenase family)